jgi:hypothetical protein
METMTKMFRTYVPFHFVFSKIDDDYIVSEIPMHKGKYPDEFSIHGIPSPNNSFKWKMKDFLENSPVIFSNDDQKNYMVFMQRNIRRIFWVFRALQNG